MKYYNFLIILIFLSTATNAQRIFASGYLRDSITHFPIIDGTINNATTNKSVQTNAQGFFRIEVGPEDFLYASAKSYHFDTLKYAYIHTDTLVIFLAPSGNVLPNVIVRSNLTKYQIDSIDRKETFEKLRGTKLNTISNSHGPGFGLTVNLDKVFKKKYRTQKTDEDLFKRFEKEAYVQYRFSPHLVAAYTGLKGAALQKFINRFSPDYNWLRNHPTNEDVLYYINEKLKLVRKEK